MHIAPSEQRPMTDPVAGPIAPSRSMIRPVLGLLAGLGVVVMIVGIGTLVATLAMLRNVNDPTNFRPTPGYLAVALAINALGSFAGGFASSRITAGRSFYTVGLLSLLLFVSGAIPAFRHGAGPGEPAWYPLTLALLATVGVLLGGAFERRRAHPSALA